MKKRIKKLAIVHEKSKKELVRKIKLCNEYKEAVILFANDLRNRYKNKEIDELEYREKLYSRLKGREPEQWIRYYDEYIELCKKEFNRVDNDAGIWLKDLANVILLLLLMVGAIFFAGSMPSGYTILEDAYIFAGKDNYTVGEMAHLFVVPSDVDYEIEVYDPDGSLYASALNFPVEKAGTYKITAVLSYENNSKNVSAEFNVIEEIDIGEIPEDIANGSAEEMPVNESFDSGNEAVLENESINITTVNLTITKLQQNMANATVNITGESENITAPAANVSAPTNITLEFSSAAGALSSQKLDITFTQADIIDELEKDEEGNDIPVSKIEKNKLKLKIRGADKSRIRNVWFRDDVLHVDPVNISDATLGIPLGQASGIIIPPKLYIRNSSNEDFRLARPYEKNNKTFNKVRVTEEHYEFNVEHFSEFNLTGGINFTTLTQALFWVNGTNNITLVVSGNNTYYNNSDHSVMNASLFNTTGLILAYNFENDAGTTITDYTDQTNGTSNAGVESQAGHSYIMQTAKHLNRTANNAIDTNQNIQNLSDGNFSFLIGGLKMYDNNSASYTNALSVWSQINPATFKGTTLLYGIGNSNAITFCNIAAGGASDCAQLQKTFGTEYCLGGFSREISAGTWNLTLYMVSKDGEQVNSITTTKDPSDTTDTYIGQVAGTVDISPNMTIGSIAFYDDNRKMDTADIRDFCYGRLERYYGYGEDSDGRINIQVDDNLTIANYVLDANNQTATGRRGIDAALSHNVSNYKFINNTFYDFGQHIRLIGSSTKRIVNSEFSGNYFRNIQVGAVHLDGLVNSSIRDSLFNNTAVSIELSNTNNNRIYNNNFSNTNFTSYLGMIYFSSLASSQVNDSIYNNWFGYLLHNGTAIFARATDLNITNNTFHNGTIYGGSIVDNETFGIIAVYNSKNISISLNNFYGTGINRTGYYMNAGNVSFCVNGEGNFYQENINSSWIPQDDCGQVNETHIAGIKFNPADFFTANWTKQSSTKTVTYEIIANKSDGTKIRMGNTTLLNISLNAALLSPGNYTLIVIPYVNSSRINATNAESGNFTINSPPTVSSVLLNATSLNNLTVDNLTAHPSGIDDVDGDNVDLNFNWLRDGISDTVLNMPFTKTDGNNKTYDLSGYDNHGTVINATWNSTGGINGFGAFEFDGVDSYITAGNDSSLNINNMTIELWLNYRSGLSGKRGELVTKLQAGFKGYGLNKDPNNKITWYTSNGINSASLTSSVGISANTWYHIAVTNDPGTKKIYINGIERGSSSGVTISNSTLNLTIGRTPTGEFPFNGTIDDVRIYKRVLSADEIRLLYENKTNTTHFNATSAGENWTVKVTPIDSDGANGTAVFSNLVNVTGVFLSVASQAISNVPAQEVNDTAPVNPNQNLTIKVNATVIGGGLDTVWITIWETVKSAANVLWEGVMALVGGFWQTDVPVNYSYPAGVVNYTIYANLTGGNVTEIEGNFSVNSPPTIGSVLLNATTRNNQSIDNLTATPLSASDPDGHDITFNFNWLRNGTSDAVLNMPFTAPDNNDMTYDFSGNNFHGTLEDTAGITKLIPSWNRTGGILGGAYNFTANTGINVTNSEKYNFQTGDDFTLEHWVKFEPGSDGAHILGRSPSGQAGVPSGYFTGKDSLDRFTFKFDTLNNHCTGTSNISDNSWHHVAAVYNGTGCFCYVDGVLENVGKCTEPISSTDYSFIVGGITDVLNKVFSGYIDELRLYNRTLSSEEISSHYNLKYNQTVGNETMTGENWTVKATPIDEYGLNGSFAFSNSVTVNNSAPVISSVLLNATSLDNLTFDNLTANPSGVSDPEGDNVELNFNWYRNGVSDAMLNIPFTLPGTLDRIYDFSGNENYGTLINGTFNKTGGYNGFGAVELDGDADFVNITNTSMAFTTEASLVMWIKLAKNTPIVGSETGLASLSNDTQNTHYPWTDGNIYMDIFKSARVAFSDNSFDKTQWHQLAVTIKPGVAFSASYSPQVYENIVFDDCVQFRDENAGNTITVAADDTSIPHASGFNNYSVWLYQDDDTPVLGCGAYANATVFIDRNYGTSCETAATAQGGVCYLHWLNAFNGTGLTTDYTLDTNINSTSANPAYLKFDHRGYRVYQNTTLIFNGTGDNSIPQLNGDKTIGKSLGDYYLNGLIDDVMIWNRTLTVNEIKLLYERKINTTHSDATKGGENWTVKATPIDSEGLNGTSVFSNSINVTQMFLSLESQTVSNVPSQIVNDTAPVNPQQNLTIKVNATVIGGGLDTVWITIWETVKSAANVLWEGVMALVGGFWQTDVPVNYSYPAGVVNYTIYANLTGGNVTEIEGNFSVNSPPTIGSVLLNATTRNNQSIDNLTATPLSASDPDGHDITFNFNWLRNGTSDAVLNMPFTAPDNQYLTYDFSGYDYHGNISGADWNRTGGIIGGAYNFTSNSKINITSSFNETRLDFEQGESFTLEYWVRYFSNSGSQVTLGKVPDAMDAANAEGYFGGKKTGNFFFTAGDISANTCQGSSNITDNTWHLVAGAYNGTGCYCYVDGVLEKVDTCTASFLKSNQTFVIGGLNDILLRKGFQGLVDELRVYNRTLSTEEISNHYNLHYNETVSNETLRGENWTVKATPIDGYGLNGSFAFSNSINISNTPPNNVTLTHPANNNLTLFNRTPTFNWTAASDDDGDSITYILNITQATCPDILVTGITATGYSLTENLCIDKTYNWTVYASDGEHNSTGRNTWGFRVASNLIITLTNNTVDFGSVTINDEYNTSYEGAPNPFVLQNDGNTEADVVTVSANKSLWDEVGLDTIYFQFKANNRTTEADAFNWSGSAAAFTNVKNTSVENTSVISQLNFTDSKDNAEIDIRIKVPAAEPAGAKFTNMIITGAVSG